MTGPAVATGSGPDAAASVDASVGFACLAAGLLVAQQVAAKATRDALFLSNFPVTTLPIAAGLTAGISLAGLVVLETLQRTDRARVLPRAAPTAPSSPSYAFGLIRREAYLRNVAVLVGLCALTECVLDYVLSAAVTTRFGRGAPLMSFFA